MIIIDNIGVPSKYYFGYYNSELPILKLLKRKLQIFLTKVQFKNTGRIKIKFQHFMVWKL